jgi:hypothetical protein
MRTNFVEPGRSHVTIWRTRTACWIIKSTHPLTQYVIFIAFPLQQWLHEPTSMLRYTYIDSLAILGVRWDRVSRPAAASCCIVDCVWNVMARAQKPDFVFRRNGRVRLNRQRCHFSRLLSAEVSRISSSNAGYTMLPPPTPFSSFPFTSPSVRHRVPSHFNWTLPLYYLVRPEHSKAVTTTGVQCVRPCLWWKMTDVSVKRAALIFRSAASISRSQRPCAF